MVKKQNKNQRSESGVVLHVNLLGVIVFSLALVLAAALVTYGVTRPAHVQPVSATELDPTLGPAPAQVPPWGELSVRDIRIKPPEEYLAFEVLHISPPTWNFDGTSQDRVRQVMLAAGLTQEQVNQAMMPSKVSVSGSSLSVRPDDSLISSMSPQTRAKLYHELGRNAGNEHMTFPFSYSPGEFEEAFAADKISPAVAASVKKLLYPRGNLQCFSDYEFVLSQIKDKAEQLRLLSVLTTESALMAGVRIRPETDVDKLLGYWAGPGGIRIKDVEPLLESLKSVPDGRIGVVYLLPQFARQRLYTFPMPSGPGDPTMDCHWTTMNFFNDVPDNRFTDPAYTVQYLADHYYQIAKPSRYGDIILFMEGNSNNAIHSAVYLCDDIVFTKNGNNMAKPWMLMHLKDLTEKYESDNAGRVLVYRNRKW
jgi:hypothetical protein